MASDGDYFAWNYTSFPERNCDRVNGRIRIFIILGTKGVQIKKTLFAPTFDIVGLTDPIDVGVLSYDEDFAPIKANVTITTTDVAIVVKALQKYNIRQQ